MFGVEDAATTAASTLSLHDALPIFTTIRCGERDGSSSFVSSDSALANPAGSIVYFIDILSSSVRDRKSTRLNSSHSHISYAVFCLKKNQQRDRRDARHAISAAVTRT